MEKYRILLVEDDNVIAEQVKDYLERWGYDMVCVKDFQNVLKDFSQAQPHLVLMDIGLPFYNGYHWCAQIRQVSQVPVIFVSSAGDNMNIVMAVNMGGDDFVTKPFDSSEIEEAIKACLKRRIGLKTVEAYRNRKLYQVRQREIAYVNSYGSYVELMVRGKRFRKEASMEEMEKLLEPRLFSRADRKYLVNLGHVDDYKNGIVTIGEEKIKASRRRKKEFERAYIEFDLEYRGKL